MCRHPVPHIGLTDYLFHCVRSLASSSAGRWTQVEGSKAGTELRLCATSTKSALERATRSNPSGCTPLLPRRSSGRQTSDPPPSGRIRCWGDTRTRTWMDSDESEARRGTDRRNEKACSRARLLPEARLLRRRQHPRYQVRSSRQPLLRAVGLHLAARLPTTQNHTLGKLPRLQTIPQRHQKMPQQIPCNRLCRRLPLDLHTPHSSLMGTDQ